MPYLFGKDFQRNKVMRPHLPPNCTLAKYWSSKKTHGGMKGVVRETRLRFQFAISPIPCQKGETWTMSCYSTNICIRRTSSTLFAMDVTKADASREKCYCVTCMRFITPSRYYSIQLSGYRAVVCMRPSSVRRHKYDSAFWLVGFDVIKPYLSTDRAFHWKPETILRTQVIRCFLRVLKFKFKLKRSF